MNKVARAYDSITEQYDTETMGDAWMREILHRHYLSTLRPGGHILDLGCGTGQDSIFLARNGYTVTAIDTSSRMIKELRSTVDATDLAQRIKSEQMNIDELDKLPAQAYDGIISGFASLNTVSNLRRFARNAHRLLQTGGQTIFHLINPFSLWEFGYLLKCGRLRQALRLPSYKRRTYQVGGVAIEHRLFYPDEGYDEFFASLFSLARVYGLGIIRPPVEKNWIPQPISAGLARLEKAVRHTRPFPNLGRFYVMEMEKR